MAPSCHADVPRLSGFSTPIEIERTACCDGLYVDGELDLSPARHGGRPRSRPIDHQRRMSVVDSLRRMRHDDDGWWCASAQG